MGRPDTFSRKRSPAASPPPGTVTVTATLGAFANSLVKVNTADTASASVTAVEEYNPPVPPEDESTLGKSYYWSATVKLSSTANGTYSPAPQGDYTLTLSGGGTDASTVITVTPKVAGYWEVSASCQVTVGQLLSGVFATTVTPAASTTPLVWVGMGTTGIQKFTSAVVTFSPSPIVTGADKANTGGVFTPVVATVSPSDLASSVTVDTYVELSGGTGAAITKNAVPNAQAGTIKFDVAGTAGTAASMPNGDLELEAKDSGTVLGTDMVIVQVPTGIGKHSGWSGPVTPQDEPLNSATSPTLPSVPPTAERLCAVATHNLPVQVVDQFGNPLGAEYKGHGVSEMLNGASAPINQALNGSGTYSDPVGVYNEGRLVQLGNPDNFAYPQLPATVPASTENTPVMVAGYTLNPSVANRTVSYTNGTLTVTWP